MSRYPVTESDFPNGNQRERSKRLKWQLIKSHATARLEHAATVRCKSMKKRPFNEGAPGSIPGSLKQFSTELSSFHRLFHSTVRTDRRLSGRRCSPEGGFCARSAQRACLDRAIVVAVVAVADVEVITDDGQHHRVCAVDEEAVFDGVRGEVARNVRGPAAVPAPRVAGLL